MRIVVLLGGTSAERDVSIASGLRVTSALREKGHLVIPVDPATGVLDEAAVRAAFAAGVRRAPPATEALASLRATALGPMLAAVPEVRGCDVVFNALHGGDGEDGTVQAILDSACVRYTGSGALASALAMDKELSKTLMRAAGVSTPEWLMAPATAEQVHGTLGFPVIVKPSKQGSTVGLTLVKDPGLLDAAVCEAFRHDDEVILERFVPGRELTVGILGTSALPVGEIFPVNELYDYEAKYTPGMAREEFPARLEPAAASAIKRRAECTFRTLKLRGYARIDFRMADDGTFYCLEANTNPGLTELSLIPQAAAAAGIPFPDLCERIVHLAMPPREESR
jgi:D-alanine-D-alanine ligase